MRKAPQKGKQAEDAAEKYLAETGYEILRRNVRIAGGELDIIAMEGKVLAFVEVKAGLKRGLEQCLAAIDHNKRQRLCQAASAFAAAYNPNLNCRFDVVAVNLRQTPPLCTLWRDAFRPQGE